jgi:4-hydroxybenzoate polyprenyltransferase
MMIQRHRGWRRLLINPTRLNHSSIPPKLGRHQLMQSSFLSIQSPNTPNDSSATNTTHTDPPTWIEKYLPEPLRPYAYLARIDKPIGTWLLLWPCCWSTALATAPGALPDPRLLGLFGIGAFCMRGAGCTINDLWDKDLDKQVVRTANRPLASGVLTTNQAVGFLGLQLATGLAVLVTLPHTHYCVQLGVASLPLVLIYPLMKRYTRFPQFVLGLTFNWGAFMGWAATHGSLDLGVVLPLYASGVTWTMVYDTLYAHQDKLDDAKLGIKSTALTFGAQTKPILQGFAMATYAGWLLAAPFTMVGTAGLTGAYAHLVWQIQSADLDDPLSVADRFRSNHTVGAIVFGSLVAGNWFMI